MNLIYKLLAVFFPNNKITVDPTDPKKRKVFRSDSWTWKIFSKEKLSSSLPSQSVVKFFVTKAARPQLVNSLGGRRSGEGNLSPPIPKDLMAWVWHACVCFCCLVNLWKNSSQLFGDSDPDGKNLRGPQIGHFQWRMWIFFR